jgi:hypothetical protein
MNTQYADMGAKRVRGYCIKRHEGRRPECLTGKVRHRVNWLTPTPWNRNEKKELWKVDAKRVRAGEEVEGAGEEVEGGDEAC